MADLTTTTTPYHETGRLPDEDGATLSAEQSGSDSASDGQNGSRKRRRPMNVTCEACKQRKVKCDRALPACGWCTKNHHVCEYKERKKPGLRAGYGRELEHRLGNLEALVREQGRQLDLHLQQSCALPRATSPGQNPFSNLESHDGDQYRHTTEGQGSANEAAATLIDPTLHSAVSRNASLQHDNDHYSSHDGLQHRSHHDAFSASSPSLTSPHSAATFQQPQPALTESAAPLPPYDLLYTIVDLYFRHINIWLPLLDRKSTLDTLFGPAPLSEADKVLLHAIVASTLRFSSDPRLTSSSRQHYHTTSKQKVQLFGIENTSVRSLQALIILALDVTGTTNGPPGWNLLSLISRAVVQLGLAVEAISSLNTPTYPSIATLRATILPEPRSFIEDEERRRLFWSVYLLDRYATVATAFEFALDEKEIDRRLPCRDDLFLANKSVETRWFRKVDRSHHMTGAHNVHGHFAYHCDLLGILGQIHQFLRRPIDIGSLEDVEQWQGSYRALDGELNAWHFGLPEDFGSIDRLMKTKTSAKPASCGWIMLHAAYHLTMIRLNSSAAYPSQTSAIFSSSYSAMQRCLFAVERMKQLGQLVKTSGLLDKVGLPFAFTAWVSARVMLVHGSTTDLQIDPDVDFFVSLLSDMGQWWDVAQRYSDILSRVLDEYRASQRAATGGRVTPSTMRILADMRRCAYDLDFLISRQPNSAVKSTHPTRVNTPAPHELEYLDVFDLFNFPRIPVTTDAYDDQMQEGQVVDPGPATDLNNMAGAMTMPNFAVPDPQTDWLFHST